jgi:hypothetical protein
MPRASWPVKDSEGRVIGIACGTVPYCTACKRRAGSKRCDYPVKKRSGKAGTCDRWLCGRCAVSVGEDLDHCPPHARLAAAK